MKRILFLSLIICAIFTQNADAQVFDPGKGCVIDINGDCVPNTILSAVPFLRINPDARSGAMGDAGIATSVDPNAMHFNAAKLAFSKQNFGIGATYTPWLRNLGLNDVYMAYLTGFRKVDELQSVGFGLRFFSLGEINFTDADSNPLGTGSPREMEFSVAYARKLSPNFSAGLTAKYIYSNLATGQVVGGGSGPTPIFSANAFAADISLNWRKDHSIAGKDGEWRFGLVMSNVGSKISYTRDEVKDFIPANLGLGAALDLNFDDFNSMTFTLDINKLLVPSPIARNCGVDANGDVIICEGYDDDNNGVADFREKGLFSGIFGSFGDAQGGFGEEMKELNYSFGMEYWYNKQFAVRAGYFYEHPDKGDRQFLTVGFGVKYNIYEMNLSYLTPTNNRRNPLDNTLRFSILFDFTGDSNN